MTAQKPTGLTRITKAFGYSWDGFRAACESETAMRQELVLLAIGIPLACWLDISGVERALLIGSLLLIMLVELINTAIETTIERVSSEQHPLSKKAKDLGSAAVLVSLINAAMVWTAILLDA